MMFISHSIVPHDRLVNAVARVARHCGVVTQVEPKVDENDDSRADGHLFFHAQSGLFDVAVAFPGSKKYRTCVYPLGAARWRETQKVTQYGDRAAQQGALFYPVVLESYGALGIRCKELISKIAEEGDLNGIKKINGMTVQTYLSKVLSFTLQSGNALVDIQGSKLARARLHQSADFTVTV